MARTINILPEHIANKIRAGEVVQRPESVVKELVENAIDAGATAITVSLRGAGKSLIQVIDNGAGMSSEDAMVACLHHATSKLGSVEDLVSIRTLGFRGEALASIASVSHLEIRTRRAEDDLAFVVRIEGGTVMHSGQDSGSVGTSVTVKHLFFNTPARRNFLKSDTTEQRHCVEAVHRVAIAFPGVAIKLISNDDVGIDVSASDLGERLVQLYGRKFSDQYVPVEEVTDLFTVRGFVSRPNFARQTKGDQYLFLNDRYIHNKSLTYAVTSAYEHVLIKGSYPSFFLFIVLDPKHVDVNVHPQKLEVKFDDERSVFNVVHSVVKKGLRAFALFPDALMSGEGGNAAGLSFGGSSDLVSMGNFRVDVRTGEVTGPTPAGGGTDSGIDVPPPPDPYRSLFAPRGERDDHAYYHDMLRSDVAEIGSSIWQVHNKYIMAQIRSGIIIVDQHVAHERVLYERALQRVQGNIPFTQSLLFPCSISLSPPDLALVKSMLGELEPLGFALRFFGKDTVIIDGVPQDVKAGSEQRVFNDLLGEARNFDQIGVGETRDMVAKTFACKAAIKAGDRLTAPEMHKLIDELFATNMPYVCPHGRPIVIKLSLAELDRRFGRPVQTDV
jgi:DNA mismatch repair protein MutL